jgi:hypothetical protein
LESSALKFGLIVGFVLGLSYRVLRSHRDKSKPEA